MTKQPYPEEFKIEAVKQITERGHRVADVSTRLGVKPAQPVQVDQDLCSARARTPVADDPDRGAATVEG